MQHRAFPIYPFALLALRRAVLTYYVYAARTSTWLPSVRIKRKRSYIFVFIILFLPLHAAHAGESKRLHIVASIGLLADIAAQVAGSEAEVTSLIPPGEEVHGFEPAPRDLQRLSKADVIIINGLGLEHGLEPMLESSQFHGALVIASHEVTPRQSAEHGVDPHAWQDVANAKRYVKAIRDALMEADPAKAPRFRENAQAYLAKLDELDLWIKQQIEQLPADRRVAITTHEAFGYFADAYGFTFISAQGLSPQGHLSAAGLARLIDQVRDGKVKTIFLENKENSRLMQQLVEEAGAVIGGELYADRLAQAGKQGGDYISLMRHNVRVLTEALQK